MTPWFRIHFWSSIFDVGRHVSYVFCPDQVDISPVSSLLRGATTNVRDGATMRFIRLCSDAPSTQPRPFPRNRAMRGLTTSLCAARRWDRVSMLIERWIRLTIIVYAFWENVMYASSVRQHNLQKKEGWSALSHQVSNSYYIPGLANNKSSDMSRQDKNFGLCLHWMQPWFGKSSLTGLSIDDRLLQARLHRQCVHDPIKALLLALDRWAPWHHRI
jgi:hypothetical protein